jgi:hypothetical protein
MNEFERMCAEVRPPGEQAVEEGRLRLLSAARGTGGRRPLRRPALLPRTRVPSAGPGGAAGHRRRVRLVALGTLTAAVVTGTAIAQNLNGTDPKGNPPPAIPSVPLGPVTNAAETLDRAAVTAEKDPSVPRPDQWIFIEDKARFPAIGTRLVTPKTPLEHHDSMVWYRADGKQYARLVKKPFGDGKIQITDIANGGSAGWKHDYPTLAAMPADQNLVPAWMAARDNTDLTRMTAAERVTYLARNYSSILRNGVVPPKAEASIFRAMTRLPGVTLKKDPVDVAGRKALAVVLVEEGTIQTEILIDRKTYHYLGERSITIKDRVTHGDDGTFVEKKGSVLDLGIRVATGIVDKPGQTP